jgi:prepilin-type N-terminal cleavage/methylation domain-containing protein
MVNPRRFITTRRGVSLLEVVLALAILAVAAAYLAQSMNLATENALIAERLTQAEIVAESVMNQVVAGVIPAQAVSWTGYTSANPMGATALRNDDSHWMYAIQTGSAEVQGMISVEVSVREVRPNEAATGPADFYVNRWIIDPSLGLDTPPDNTQTGNASTTGAAGGTGATAGGAAGGRASGTGGVQ